MRFHANVYVTLKPTVNDPQGTTVMAALHALGFESVSGVRVGKFMTIELNATNATAATESVDRMCKRLLANPVIESYELEVKPGT